MLVLPDGIDRTRIHKLGPDFSCIPTGWPFCPPKKFRLLNQQVVQPFVDPLPPNTSAMGGNKPSILMFVMMVLVSFWAS